MKITVWHGCETLLEFEIPDAPGCDLTIDPWANLLGPDYGDWHPVSRPYDAGRVPVSEGQVLAGITVNQEDINRWLSQNDPGWAQRAWRYFKRS